MIDLIYVEYKDGRTMSCAVLEDGIEKLLGPVPSSGAVSVLATLLQKELPARFASVKDAENHLAFVHFKNMTKHQNSSGQSYPFKIDALMS